jgi:CheY-like chemotaxis protein
MMQRHDNPRPLLLVEDNENDALLIRRAFERAHLLNPLEVATDGSAAIGYLSSCSGDGHGDRLPPPALVLLDLNLPRQSGMEVLSWIRRHPELSHLPVVILTGSREAEDLSQAYERGANGYLTKPVDFVRLLELVRQLNLYWVILPPPVDVTD